MTNKLNIDNLRIFVEALNKLPTEIKNNEIDMNSANEPVCGTPGCHAGLFSIVANDIPKLKSLYDQDFNGYDYLMWQNTLAVFLGFDDRISLTKWGSDNPELWGNEYSVFMFCGGEAFGQKTNLFPHSVIIGWWTTVLHRVENKTEK